jgi:hypothetical protein
VVNEKGEPFSNAIATLLSPPCKGCIDYVAPSSQILPDGIFSISAENTTARRVEVFIVENIPSGFWSPYSPVAEKLTQATLASRSARYRGVIVNLSKKSIDLGDITPHVRYGKVMVDLANLIDSQYKPAGDGPTPFSISISDSKGKLVIDRQQIPASALDAASRALKLALPNGRWALEIISDKQNKQIPALRFFVNTMPSRCTRVMPNERELKRGVKFTPCN